MNKNFNQQRPDTLCMCWMYGTGYIEHTYTLTVHNKCYFAFAFLLKMRDGTNGVKICFVYWIETHLHYVQCIGFEETETSIKLNRIHHSFCPRHSVDFIAEIITHSSIFLFLFLPSIGYLSMLNMLTIEVSLVKNLTTMDQRDNNLRIPQRMKIHVHSGGK